MRLSAFTNIFAGNPLDRASDRRLDPNWLKISLADPRTVAIALWNGAPLVRVTPDGGAQLAYFPLSLAAEIEGIEERRLFLGLSEAASVFAIHFEGSLDPSEGLLQGHGGFESLRGLALRLPKSEAAVAATAKAVFEWHSRHRYCSFCGARSQVVDGGWKRVCSACASQHFPRTDPFVIMLPTRDDLCLLGRQASWPPGLWSAFAGFLEPGESIEEACARELKEETALATLAVRYHSSQPWPYPSSLMIGLFADVAEGEAIADQTEIEALRWFTRMEARHLLAGKMDGAHAPAAFAIAHELIKAWVEAAPSE